MKPYEVSVSTGSLREPDPLVVAPHRWTDGGVAVRGSFTGAHLLHLAVGGCVLNDVHREAAAAGIDLRGVRVTVSGDLDPVTWRSSGIAYGVEVDTAAGSADVEALLDRVEAVAEIPRALAAGIAVVRTR